MPVGLMGKMPMLRFRFRLAPARGKIRKCRRQTQLERLVAARVSVGRPGQLLCLDHLAKQEGAADRVASGTVGYRKRDAISRNGWFRKLRYATVNPSGASKGSESDDWMTG